MVDLDLVSKADHIPVLIEPIIENILPVKGVWIDATFGAGGYTRALLEAGAEFVFADTKSGAADSFLSTAASTCEM